MFSYARQFVLFSLVIIFSSGCEFSDNGNESFSEDNSAPIILINGQNTVTISVGAGYADAGAVAYDGEDGFLPGRLVTRFNVNTSLPGTYHVIYEVTDSAGLSTAVTRIVKVISDEKAATPVDGDSSH